MDRILDKVPAVRILLFLYPLLNPGMIWNSIIIEVTPILENEGTFGKDPQQGKLPDFLQIFWKSTFGKSPHWGTGKPKSSNIVDFASPKHPTPIGTGKSAQVGLQKKKKIGGTKFFFTHFYVFVGY